MRENCRRKEGEVSGERRVDGNRRHRRQGRTCRWTRKDSTRRKERLRRKSGINGGEREHVPLEEGNEREATEETPQKG